MGAVSNMKEPLSSLSGLGRPTCQTHSITWVPKCSVGPQEEAAFSLRNLVPVLIKVTVQHTVLKPSAFLLRKAYFQFKAVTWTKLSG